MALEAKSDSPPESQEAVFAHWYIDINGVKILDPSKMPKGLHGVVQDYLFICGQRPPEEMLSAAYKTASEKFEECGFDLEAFLPYNAEINKPKES